MSKELEALEELFDVVLEEYSGCEIMSRFLKDKNIIEAALKENQARIEELEETNHLMFIREHKNTKKLKALEIIKNNLNITEILLAVKGVCSTKDYELVKEVLL